MLSRNRYNGRVIRCPMCGGSLVGRRPQTLTCSPRCRVALHRAGGAVVPREMLLAKRWIRYSDAERKVPLNARTGRGASVTSPRSWSTFGDAIRSDHGVGLGFVLGDGFGCYDLDHVLVDREPVETASAFLARRPEAYVEVSPSGDGLHVWGWADEAPGYRRIIDGIHVERYSVDRYITVTLDVFRDGQLVDLDPAL